LFDEITIIDNGATVRFSFQDIVNSRIAIASVLRLAQILPIGIGYGFARIISSGLSKLNNIQVVRVVRANQWVISGHKLQGDDLNTAVRNTLNYAIRGIFDTYHYLNNDKTLLSRVNFTPGFQEMIDNSRTGKEGIISVLIHQSNFDFVGFAAAKRGLRCCVLSVPQPASGYKWQNDLRTSYGLETIPTTRNSLKLAVNWLNEGRTVMTGIDRPIPESKHTLDFFGRPAHLPVSHIVLALETHVRMQLWHVIRQSNNVYLADVSEPMELERQGDRHTLIATNAQHILSIAEEKIRLAPHQWAMFYPVWPDAIEEMP
jgi:KDO2-lipid IV(A) lauroyltransferase